jgi:hypothetical protein
MTDATESPITCDVCDTPIPIPADAADDFAITCPGCGRQHGTWGGFKADATAQMAAAVKAALNLK